MDNGVMDDGDLVRAVRRGEPAAFGVLFSRHVAVALRVAARYGRVADAEDVVSEVFARVLGQIRAGGGPTSSFRAYLLTAVRHEAGRRAVLARRCEPVADIEPWTAVVAPAAAETDDRLREAYASLPARWQRTLWQLEVEGRRPQELASELGLSANAVSALGYRARAALRSAYLGQSQAA